MNVIVVGCGRMGAELAYRLYQQGSQVVVIDQGTASFDNLHPDFRGRTIEGDGLAQDVLNRAGIEEAGGLAAVTNSDVVNAVVGHVARTVYHVPKVIVRNYDSRWQTLHDAFGSPVVSSTVWAAQRIEELFHHDDMRVVFSAGNGEVSLYEFVAPESCQGCTLQDLFPEDQCRVVAVTRAGHAMLPSAELQLDVGDVILLSATPANMSALRPRLNLRQEG
ncbi:MAG: NAD-binding protein [Chloroflexi bacterium]|nr:NAD-binding protein [Chloroflexota bacterium]